MERSLERAGDFNVLGSMGFSGGTLVRRLLYRARSSKIYAAGHVEAVC